MFIGTTAKVFFGLVKSTEEQARKEDVPDVALMQAGTFDLDLE